MDIRSLLDSDVSGSKSKAPATPSAPRKASSQDFKPSQESHQGLYHDRAQEHRPPQPPPLRPPVHSEFRSPSISSYNTAQSPYQKTPSSSLSAGQYPFPQPSIHSPAHSVQAVQQHQYEGQASAVNRPQREYGQAGSLPQTPTSATPSSSYPSFQQHRPPSSHSASTPTSGHTQTPTFPRDSPQQTHAQIRGPYIPHPNHQYVSQPGTPLGPPTAFGRQSSSLRHESPGSYDHQRSNSGGSHAQQQQIIHSPNSTIQYPSKAGGLPPYTRSSPHQSVTLGQERERSLSVSPKTKLPSQLPTNPSATPVNRSGAYSEQATSAKRKIGDPRLDEPSLLHEPAAKRSMSLGVGGMLNADLDEQHDTPHVHYNTYPPVPPDNQAYQQGAQESASQLRGVPSSSVPGQGITRHTSIPSVVQEIPTSPPPAEGSFAPGFLEKPYRVSHIPADATGANEPRSSRIGIQYTKSMGSRSEEAALAPDLPVPQSNAAKTRVRYREVPIFAQSARHNSRRGPLMNIPLQAVHKSPSIINQQPQSTASHPPAQEANGHSMSSNSLTQSPLDPTGILGPWEPSITNVIPAEELTREIMNYLFGAVIQMNGVTFGPAGGTAGRGAMVEIEAKIGQIIDKTTNDRIRIPVMTECIVSRTDPNLRTAFRSSMTEVSRCSFRYAKLSSNMSVPSLNTAD